MTLSVVHNHLVYGLKPIDHYTTEILPYTLRSKGLAIFTSVQNCANALSESCPGLLGKIADTEQTNLSIL